MAGISRRCNDGGNICERRKLICHKGGYSTFRVNITPVLKEGENLLAVRADNGKNREVYPQKADFTFYGGIYRDVYLLVVPGGSFRIGA